MRNTCLVCGETFSNIECHKHYDEHKRILNAANKEQSNMRCTCAKCDITFASISDYQKHICGMEIKMTREEALNKLKNIKTPLSVENIVDILEEVGVLEFEEEKKIERLFEINTNNVYYDAQELYPNGLKKFNDKYGVVRLEEWPEGLVLWVGGQIVWKSWIQYWRKGDGVMIEYYDGLTDEKKKQTGIIV